MRFYAGIGSRETPVTFLTAMSEIAYTLAARNDYTLRSGAADGADTAFERGANNARLAGSGPKPEIYLPWAGFNRTSEQRMGLPESRLVGRQLSAQATVIARDAHPDWGRLSQSARWLHTRNVAQVLGDDCETPSDFVLCWTKGGRGKGGTGQAIRVADKYNIPVYDMGLLALPYIRNQLKQKFGVNL